MRAPPACSAKRGASVSGEGRPAYVVSSRVELGGNAGSAIAVSKAAVELVEGGDERLGHEPAAVRAEVAGGVGEDGNVGLNRHRVSLM